MYIITEFKKKRNKLKRYLKKQNKWKWYLKWRSNSDRKIRDKVTYPSLCILFLTISLWKSYPAVSSSPIISLHPIWPPSCWTPEPSLSTDIQQLWQSHLQLPNSPAVFSPPACTQIAARLVLKIQHYNLSQLHNLTNTTDQILFLLLYIVNKVLSSA